MNVDRMRKIDYFVGVPLSFCVSIFLRFLRKKPAPGQCQNALFIELSEMGSTLLVDPAMKKLKSHFSADLYFVIFETNQLSLKILNTVPAENIFTMRHENIFHLAIDTLRFLIWTRKNRIDTVVDLELFSRFTAILTALSGARNRVGFFSFHNEGLYRGDMLTHNVAYNPHIHISKNFIALVNALISEQKEIPYSKTVISDEEVQIEKVSFSEEEKRAFLSRIEEKVPSFVSEKNRLVLVNANASDMLPQRRWMPEKFSEVITRILENHPDVVVLLTGSLSEQEWIEDICQRVGKTRCVNFCGGVKFLELPLLYSVSTLMLTNDSGPAHFASVTDLPTYVIFGPETPGLYGSLGNFIPIYAGLACSPCVSATNHRKTPCLDNVCLKVIQPQEVYQTISQSL